MSDYALHCGDAVTVLRTLPSGSVQTAITSPPYYGLRSYLPDDHPDKEHELGAEETPEAYVSRMVDVFREVRRVLRDDGVLWLNIGDSYNSAPAGNSDATMTAKQRSNNGSLARWGQGKMVKETRMRLRSDLTPQELTYVLEELAKHSRMDSVTVEGDE